MHGGNITDLLAYVVAEVRSHRRPRRKPPVAVTSYVCLACRELHYGRAACLPLGCVEAAPRWVSVVDPS